MIRVTINGAARRLDVHPMKRVLDVLREDCELTGTKEGCGEGECGACTIVIDGLPVNSCLVPAAQLEGASILTIEGLSSGGPLHAMQEAFVTEGGAQCGICTPGMIMAALDIRKGANTAAIQQALAGNLCRCTGYEAIYRSVKRGARGVTGARSSTGAMRSTGASGAAQRMRTKRASGARKVSR